MQTNRKRLLSLLLAIAMIISILPVSTFAEGETEVGSQSELAAMGSGSYILTQDITLESWTTMDVPKGTTFNGNGHTITLTGSPLFANMEGTVTNLILKGNVEQTANKNTGALCQTCYGTIRNCISDVAVTYSGSSPYIYVGQIIGSFESGNSISNCLILGSIDPGKCTTYGAAGASFSSLSISNCVAVGYDKIAYKDFSGNIEGTNCTLVAAEDYNAADYLEFFNTYRGNDMEWEIVDGALTLKAGTVSETATAEQIAALNEAIAAAEAVDKTKLYTSGSLSSYNSALSAAKSKAAETEPTASSVTSATTALNNAVAGLSERNTAPVAPPDSGVVTVTKDNFQTLLKSPTADVYYQFTEDITLTSDYWMGSFNTMNAVLDGNGYTLTLDGVSTLWSTIGENGIVQNLGIKGSVAEGYEPIGNLAKQCSGLIVNCWSEASTNNSSTTVTGGFAGNLLSGGAIVNCWNTGSITTGGSSNIGAIAGSAEGNTLIQNCYWQDSAMNVVGSGSGVVKNSSVKTRDEFASDAFVALLNENRGTYGKLWNMSSAGYPWFGEAQEYAPETPEEPVEITFTSYKGIVTTFMSDEGLTISLSDLDATNAYYAGELSMEGATSWSASEDNLIYNGNKFYPGNKTGTYTITVNYGENESRSFLVNVVEPADAVALRLVVNDEPITDGKLTVQGSEQIVFSAQVQYSEGGEWESVPTTLLSFTTTAGDDAAYVNGAVFYAKQPGTVTVTASGLSQSASVEITSEYVVVTSITPAPSGTYVVHERNANSDSLGNFVDLMLGHGVGNVNIAPGNASYQGWTLTSSDPDVAEYVDAFLKAVLPKKAGTTTLTATSSDPNADISGTSEITIQYKNPVTAVAFTGENNSVTVDAGEALTLPLTFTGTSGMEDYHVTEPGMIWTYESSDGGEVTISRDGNLGVLLKTEKEYCVANDQYKVTGVTAGTVTVTGTPVDTTNSVSPVTFTVTVVGEEEAVDVDALIAEAMPKAQDYLKSTSYSFGSEWDVFSLTRSGVTIEQALIDAYLESVVDTYSNPNLGVTGDPSPAYVTTYARVILTVGALGEDASNLSGLNLIEKMFKQLGDNAASNYYMWALLALNSGNYEIPDTVTWTEAALVEKILTFAASDGGFGLSNNTTVSVDMTGMALQSLAPYYNSNDNVKTAVDNSLTYLRGEMSDDAEFDSVESTAQVMVALTALNMDPLAEENGFVKSPARNLITGICKYRKENGQFYYAGSGYVNKMSNQQGLYALESYIRYRDKENALYDLTDVVVKVPTADELIAEAMPAAQNYLSKTSYGFNDEWIVFSLTRSGASLTETQISEYLTAVKDAISTGNVNNATTHARVAVTLGALGKDASNFDGNNLIKGMFEVLGDNELPNAYIWTLLALDSGEYDLPKDTTWTREQLIEKILAHQESGGGFYLSEKWGADVDTTGMALMALAPYYSSNVETAVNNALTYLRGELQAAGCFQSYGNNSAESTAQVLVALTALGLDPLDTANGFISSDGKNLIDGIYSFWNSETGAFKNAYGSDNSMATYQSLYALESYVRYRDNENALYDLTDVVVRVPVVEPAEDATITVTIADKGTLVLAQQEVTVTDRDEDGKLNVDEALYAAHEAGYTGGASAGYASAVGDYGLGITKLWGDMSGNYGYWLNDASCMSLEDEVKADDYLVAWVYQDAGYSDTYAKWGSTGASATTGTAMTVSLEKAGYDNNWNVVFSAMSGATIKAYNADLTEVDVCTVTDNEDGTYAVTFKTAGEYYLVATGNAETILVPTVRKVSVAQGEETTTPGDLDGDGLVLINDAIIVYRAVAGSSAVTPEELEKMDMNGDGLLLMNDAIAIYKIAAGIS